MSERRDVYLHDGNGNPIGSFRGAIDTHDADVHREIVNVAFHRHTGEIALLTVDAPAQSTTITVDTPTASMVVGAYLHIQNGTTENTHPQITVVNGNTFTLDRPLDNSFSIGDSVEVAVLNMVEDGSLASPLSFQVKPLAGQVWHLTRILYQMEHTEGSDISTFGGLNPLTNGCAVRRYDGATDTFATFTIWKTNGDIAIDMFDIDFLAQSKKGNFGTKGRGTFKNAGAIVYLDGDAGDYLEVLVQDPLASATTQTGGTMVSFTMKAQGHLEGN